MIDMNLEIMMFFDNTFFVLSRYLYLIVRFHIMFGILNLVKNSFVIEPLFIWKFIISRNKSS